MLYVKKFLLKMTPARIYAQGLTVGIRKYPCMTADVWLCHYSSNTDRAELKSEN